MSSKSLRFQWFEIALDATSSLIHSLPRRNGDAELSERGMICLLVHLPSTSTHFGRDFDR
jgi:hypothetical protein